MKIVLLGSGSDSFIASLDEAGIKYERHSPRPRSGVIMNASGDIVQIIVQAIPWTAIATVLCTWRQARASRKIIVTTKDNKVVQTEGYTVKEFEQILAHTKEMAVIDTKRSELSGQEPS